MSGASFVAQTDGCHCAPYCQQDLSLVTARWPECTSFCPMLLSVDTPGHLKALSFLALITVQGSSFTGRCNTTTHDTYKSHD